MNFEIKTSRSKILIVDDEESIRLSLGEFLRDADYEVCVAQDADEAMGILAAKNFDVVVTDIVMPKITGVKLLKAIKEASPHVQVILMTGQPAVETASEAVRAGAFDYLTKPIGKEDILKVITNAARVKFLDDERRRLLEENRLYQENLEQLVEERTEALSEKTAFLDSILRSSMDLAIAATDTDFRITYYNPAAERHHGRTASEVIGKTVMEIHTKENVEPERFEKAVETVLKEGEYRYEIVKEKEDGTHYLDSRVSGIYDKNKSLIGYLSTASDITKRRHAEEELRQESEITSKLLQISEATLKTTDIAMIIKDVVDCTQEITSNDVTLSYLYDDIADNFRPAEGAGFDESRTPLFKTELISSDISFIKKSFDVGRVMIGTLENDDFRKEFEQSGLFDWIDNISTVAVVPLSGSDKKIGLLIYICTCNCENPKSSPDCYSERRREMLQAISNHVSTALERAGLYRDSLRSAMELSRKVELIQTMSDMGKSILSTYKSKVILETTTRMITKLISCDWVRIVEVDRDSEELKIRMGFVDDEVGQNTVASFNDTSLTDIVTTGSSQYIPDIGAVVEPKLIEKKLLDEGLNSVLRVPIVIKGEVFAVLGVMSRRRSAFTPADADILEKLASHIGIALKNARLVTDLEELFIGTVKTLSGTIEAKSRWTRGHSDRVTRIGVEIGKTLGMDSSELKELELTGLLHDIGKINTREGILDKPGILSDEEMEIIKEHSSKGAEMLSSIKQLSKVIPVVRHHHEHFNGAGYPDGLKGEEIPYMSRILAVADTVDAMGADRPYRKGLSMEIILAELKKCSGTQFDPEVVDAYFKTLERMGVEHKEVSSW